MTDKKDVKDIVFFLSVMWDLASWVIAFFLAYHFGIFSAMNYTLNVLFNMPQ